MLYSATTRHFREAALGLHPALANEVYYRLYRRLLRGSYDGKEIVLSKRYLGLISKQHVNDFSAVKLLKSFKRDVLSGFEYSDYRYVDGEARRVIETGLTEEDYRLWETLHHGREADVLAETGEALTNSRLTKRLEEGYAALAKEADWLAEQYRIPYESWTILDHHNTLPASLFSRLVKPNLEDAQTWIDENLLLDNAWKDASRWRDPAYCRYRQTQDTLDDIRLTPKPVLRPAAPDRDKAGNFKAPAARLFEMEPRLGSIKSELRHILMRGANVYEIDLQSAQLAILARLWSVPGLIRLLSNGESIWTHLGKCCGGSKDALKKALYSLTYGAGRERLLLELEGLAADPETFLDGFLAVPTIQELIEARDKRMSELTMGKAEGYYLKDPLAGEPYHRAPHRELALEAQAVELGIIFAVYEVQFYHGRDFQIILYQYDGLTLRFKRRASYTRLKGKIDEAVAKKAMEDWGVRASLSWTPLKR